MLLLGHQATKHSRELQNIAHVYKISNNLQIIRFFSKSKLSLSDKINQKRGLVFLVSIDLMAWADTDST